MLNEDECFDMLDQCGQLTYDPACEKHVARSKRIAFVQFYKGEIVRSEQDFFIQNEGYNDFSGGYKRFFDLIPMDIIKSQTFQKVLHTFIREHQLPEDEWLLCQIQNNHVTEENSGRCPTGQGIHTDGHNNAGLVVLSRENISGAANSIYKDLEGTDRILGPKELAPGTALFWKDNQIYHEVGPISLAAGATEGSRAVLIIHDDAQTVMVGDRNQNNSLAAKKAEEQLRYNPEFNVDFESSADTSYESS